MDGAGKRKLHAKAWEVMCKQGRILVSTSANGTAAALEGGGNVEACLARIQRDSSSGWKFKPSEPPEPLQALDKENEHEEQTRGVTRAILDSDEIHGEILTPAISGVISVFYVFSLALEPLGNVTLSTDRRFQISAVSLGGKIMTGRPPGAPRPAPARTSGRGLCVCCEFHGYFKTCGD